MTQNFFPSLDGGGIGAIAVHPARNVFAVAEKCSHRAPNVYLYSYPDLTLLKVMEGGTERQYSSLAFNDQGDTLASVGGYPDYLLTLWNWEEEGIVLRAKAFSQDVFTVRFSPYFEGLLNTSGTGHIRFWKAASTFTGLKLQGQLGKFGNVELTDVAAFVEMPDGKVLSGTETGEMLMWDGGLIKVVLTRTMQKPCHEGSIKVLLHDRASNVILSGGDDGFVRLWQFSKINEAEADEDSSGTTIAPMDELHIAPGAKIKSLLWERRQWLILDECGALYRVTLPEAGSLSKGAIVTRLMEFHSGGIAACYLSRTSHHALTAGADGTVRVFDYTPQVHQQSCQAPLLTTLRFNAPATCAAHLTHVGDGAEAIAVGFNDGVLRLVRRCSDGLALIQAMKPHKGKILSVSINPQGDKLATLGSDDGTVFFFSLSGNSSSSGPNISVNPIGFVTLPSNSTPSCAGWSSDGTSLLIGMALSNVIEVQCPDASTVDTQGSYEIKEVIKRQVVFHLPKPPKKSKKEVEGEGEGEEGSPDDGGNADGEATEGAEEAVEEEEEEAEEQVEEQLYEIVSISQPPMGSDGDLVITLNGPQGVSDNLWLLNLNQEAEAAAKPLGPLCNHPGSITSLVKVHETNSKESFFLTGTRDGLVRVQKASPLSADGGVQGLGVEPGSKAWQAHLHDLQHGRITSLEVSFDSSHLISAAMDGSIMVHKLMIEGLSASEMSPSAEVVLPSAADVVPASVVDITQSNEYTIEEAKQKAERDALLAEAEAKKMGVREQLKLIRDEFEALLKENEARPEAERIPRSLFEIDPDLRNMIE
jgi:WD40 repeat protein